MCQHSLGGWFTWPPVGLWTCAASWRLIRYGRYRKLWCNLPPAIKTLPFPKLLTIRILTLHHIFQFRRVSRSIFHILIWRVTNYLTELDVTSIRNLFSQKRSDCILACSNFINIVQLRASNNESEQPWCLCIPNWSSFWEFSFSHGKFPISDKHSQSRSQVSPHMPSLNGFE